jgi:hypothetical protein
MDNDDYTIDINTYTDTITISGSNISTITYDSVMAGDYISLNLPDTIDIDSLTFPIPVEWEHEFPAFHKIEEMRKEYPALERAYENFKTIYTMVEQDWIGKQRADDKKY